jgi:F-type H+-transporting ATPase subunit c
MNSVKKVSVFLLVVMLATLLAIPVCATNDTEAAPVTAVETQTDTDGGSTTGLKAVAVGLAIGLAAAGGAVGMGIVGGKAADGISRQPEMEGKIRTTLMLDLVFIETAIIYALLVVILVIFVL